jgi:hypothetical protein
LKNNGFILITVLLTLVLISSLLSLLLVQVSSERSIVGATYAQLHGFQLAENGIVFAAQKLRFESIDRILKGPDGTWGTDYQKGWRDALSKPAARQFAGEPWLPNPDDGILFSPEEKPYFQSGSGYFTVRCTNNPEESPDSDSDRIVIARSIGMAPARSTNRWFPQIRNHVCSLEAKLRKERVFFPENPMTILGNGGSFLFEGNEFLIESPDERGIGLISSPGSNLRDLLMNSITPDQQQCISGWAQDPPIADLSAAFQSHSDLSRIFKSKFWDSFKENLPDFSEEDCSFTERIHFLDGDSEIDGPCRGVVVTKGHTVVSENALIQGILIHLGDGSLELKNNAVIEGGIWLTNLDISEEQVHFLPLDFAIRDKARITYDAEQIEKALSCFPATLLTWRILFDQ